MEERTFIPDLHILTHFSLDLKNLSILIFQISYSSITNNGALVGQPMLFAIFMEYKGWLALGAFIVVLESKHGIFEELLTYCFRNEIKTRYSYEMII